MITFLNDDKIFYINIARVGQLKYNTLFKLRNIVGCWISCRGVASIHGRLKDGCLSKDKQTGVVWPLPDENWSLLTTFLNLNRVWLWLSYILCLNQFLWITIENYNFLFKTNVDLSIIFFNKIILHLNMYDNQMLKLN